jgi:hypothetical protein
MRYIRLGDTEANMTKLTSCGTLGRIVFLDHQLCAPPFPHANLNKRVPLGASIQAGVRTLACWPSVILALGKGTSLGDGKTGVLCFCARRQRTCLPPSKQNGWTVTSRGAASAEPGRLAASAFAVLSTSLIQDVPISSYAFSTAVTLRVFQVSLECGWQSETLRPFVLVIFWPPFTPGLVTGVLAKFLRRVSQDGLFSVYVRRNAA